MLPWLLTLTIATERRNSFRLKELEILTNSYLPPLLLEYVENEMKNVLYSFALLALNNINMAYLSCFRNKLR